MLIGFCDFYFSFMVLLLFTTYMKITEDWSSDENQEQKCTQHAYTQKFEKAALVTMYCLLWPFLAVACLLAQILRAHHTNVDHWTALKIFSLGIKKFTQDKARKLNSTAKLLPWQTVWVFSNKFVPTCPFTIAIVLASRIKYLQKNLLNLTNLTSTLTDSYKYTTKNKSDLESSKVPSEMGTLQVPSVADRPAHLVQIWWFLWSRSKLAEPPTAPIGKLHTWTDLPALRIGQRSFCTCIHLDSQAQPSWESRDKPVLSIVY